MSVEPSKLRHDVLILLTEQREAVVNDIETCELMMCECREDPAACTALTKLQARYEAVAEEIDAQIEEMRWGSFLH